METFCSEEIGKLAQALLKVQRQLHPALKDADTPFTKSRYTTLKEAKWAIPFSGIESFLRLVAGPMTGTTTGNQIDRIMDLHRIRAWGG